MKKRSLLALMLLLCLVFTCGCNRATHEGFYLYKSSPIGFRIEYPEKWTKQVDLEQKIAAFVTPQEGFGDAYRDNLTVSFEERGEMEFDAFLEEYYASLPATFAGFTEQSRQEVLLDNKEGYKILFTSSQTEKKEDGKESTSQLKILQYVMDVDQRVYFVTFIAQPDAYEYFTPYIETMIETIRFAA